MYSYTKQTWVVGYAMNDASVYFPVYVVWWVFFIQISNWRCHFTQNMYVCRYCCRYYTHINKANPIQSNPIQIKSAQVNSSQVFHWLFYIKIQHTSVINSLLCECVCVCVYILRDHHYELSYKIKFQINFYHKFLWNCWMSWKCWCTVRPHLTRVIRFNKFQR